MEMGKRQWTRMQIENPGQAARCRAEKDNKRSALHCRSTVFAFRFGRTIAMNGQIG
jgi:hypothetical protein